MHPQLQNHLQLAAVKICRSVSRCGTPSRYWNIRHDAFATAFGGHDFSAELGLYQILSIPSETDLLDGKPSSTNRG